MSNTRRATGNGPLRQERFASSQEFERGLMANLVAKRCTVLERAEDRELVWFLQLLSHGEGGLKKIAAELCERFPERLATPAMRQIGTKPRQIYNASQVKEVRAEMPRGSESEFPLKGDLCMEDLIRESYQDDRPVKYSAADFVRCCASAAAGLETHLSKLCLDPAVTLADGSPWYFPALISTLREVQAEWIAAQQPVAVTAIGQQVCEALDYALETRRMVLIDGLARTGKTFAAKAWCAQRPGSARYVQVPSGNDDFSFFRDIARSLGVSVSLKSKAQELRSRIEETLQAGHLMVVLDEAHYLWPGSHYRHTTPGRVNWLMTALVNYAVPVALITTPQFMLSQKEIEARTCWTSEQFTGRIGNYQKLPDSLTAHDLTAVARAFVPDADKRSIEALVSYAQMSAKYLAGIEAVASRARFIARKAGRAKVEFKDVMRAIDESVIPSDNAFAAAMNLGGKPARNGESRLVPALVPETVSRSVRPDRELHEALE